MIGGGREVDIEYGGPVGGVEVGSVCGGVGGGNRTLMETFLARKMVDLIRARIESILVSRMQESTTLILA